MLNISLKQLAKDGLLMDPKCVLYDDGCCVITSVTAESMAKTMTLFRYPARLETLSLLFVENGSMSINCDMQKLDVQKNTVVVCHFGSVVDIGYVSEDFSCTILLLEQAVLERMNVSIQKVMPYIGSFHKLHALPVRPKKMEYGMRLIDLLGTCIQQNSSEHYYHESVQALLTSFVFYLLNLVTPELTAAASEQQAKSHDEEIFQRFMKELRIHFREERKISYYADRLHLSPKYFSSVIYHFSGRRPSQWINECVIAEAKNLIRFSGKNIQQIAIEMNFPTQSFFGRYFKQHTGYSPRSFKMLH